VLLLCWCGEAKSKPALFFRKSSALLPQNAEFPRVFARLCNLPHGLAIEADFA
jgi:hypothetical protein